jgi:hypothetical protein
MVQYLVFVSIDPLPVHGGLLPPSHLYAIPLRIISFLQSYS